MLERFFTFCSGADTEILSTCTKGERNKYVGIGATVFFTAIMAFTAAATFASLIYFLGIWGIGILILGVLGWFLGRFFRR